MVPGDTIGNYKIIKLLGQGGMGEVYLAVDLRLGRQVALKMISDKLINNPSLMARFQREAPAAAALTHPNICAIYDVGEWNGRPYIAMEYLEGITLHERIRSQPLSINEVLEIAIQIADALDEAREKNVVHRDIKSPNILLTERKHVKLLDFGLAKWRNLHPEVKIGSAPSQAGLVLGTVDYMSPEQARGEEVDHRSDIFSFGVVLYEMLTGHLPFSGKTIAETLGGILHQDAPPVTNYRKDVPDALCKVLNKMLQRSREERYQSAHEVWLDLKQLRSEPTQPVFVSNASVRKLRWTIATVACLVFIYLLYSSMPARFQIKTSPTLEGVNSILALPCRVFGPTEVGYLTDAIPSSLSTLLARVQNLETRVPPTSFEMEKVQGDLNKISQAYNATTFLVSSVSAEANGLVLNVQIVEASNRKVLWSNQYEGAFQDYIGITRQAAEGIRQALRPSSKSISIASTSDMAANSEAELAFRKGKFHTGRYGRYFKPEDFDEAFSAYQKALKLDSKLARAAGEIAFLYHIRYEFAFKKRDLAEVATWAQKTLAIDPLCAEGWTALSSLERAEPTIHLENMINYALRAASLGRNSYRNQMTLCFALQPVSIHLSQLAAKETHRLNPLYPYATVILMDPLIISDRSEEALSMADELLQEEPGLSMGLFYKSLIYSILGRLSESAAILKQSESLLHQERFYEDLFMIASEVYLLQARDYVAADRMHQRLSAFKDPGTIWLRLAFTTPALVRHGKQKAALELLNQGLDANVLPYDLLLMNQDLKKLQADPRFEKIFSESRTKFQEALILLRESKERGELPSYLDSALREVSANLKM